MNGMLLKYEECVILGMPAAAGACGAFLGRIF
jgi:hypothetical protein